MIELENEIASAGYDPEYYCVQDYMTQVLYSPYEELGGMGIDVLSTDGQTMELSAASTIVRGFVLGEHKEDRKIFFPREVTL